MHKFVQSNDISKAVYNEILVDNIELTYYSITNSHI